MSAEAGLHGEVMRVSACEDQFCCQTWSNIITARAATVVVRCVCSDACLDSARFRAPFISAATEAPPTSYAAGDVGNPSHQDFISSLQLFLIRR